MVVVDISSSTEVHNMIPTDILQVLSASHSVPNRMGVPGESPGLPNSTLHNLLYSEQSSSWKSSWNCWYRLQNTFYPLYENLVPLNEKGCELCGLGPLNKETFLCRRTTNSNPSPNAIDLETHIFQVITPSYRVPKDCRSEPGFNGRVS